MSLTRMSGARNIFTLNTKLEEEVSKRGYPQTLTEEKFKDDDDIKPFYVYNDDKRLYVRNPIKDYEVQYIEGKKFGLTKISRGTYLKAIVGTLDNKTYIQIIYDKQISTDPWFTSRYDVIEIDPNQVKEVNMAERQQIMKNLFEKPIPTHGSGRKTRMIRKSKKAIKSKKARKTRRSRK